MAVSRRKDTFKEVIRSGASSTTRYENVSAFFVSGDLPGITCTPLDIIGEKNKGWLVTQATLAAEHGGGRVVACLVHREAEQSVMASP